MDEPLKFLAAFVGQIWSPVGYSGCHYSYTLSAQESDQSDLGWAADFEGISGGRCSCEMGTGVFRPGCILGFLLIKARLGVSGYE